MARKPIKRIKRPRSTPGCGQMIIHKDSSCVGHVKIPGLFDNTIHISEDKLDNLRGPNFVRLPGTVPPEMFQLVFVDRVPGPQYEYYHFKYWIFELYDFSNPGGGAILKPRGRVSLRSWHKSASPQRAMEIQLLKVTVDGVVVFDLLELEADNGE